MGFYENGHSLKDGAILLYTRANRKKGAYQVRFKIPAVTGYIIKSLKTVNLTAAVGEADDLFYSLKAEQKQGLDVKTAGIQIQGFVEAVLRGSRDQTLSPPQTAP